MKTTSKLCIAVAVLLAVIFACYPWPRPTDRTPICPECESRDYRSVHHVANDMDLYFCNECGCVFDQPQRAK